MKIILSRKGFDSGYGRIPSPILPDGTLLSLPIPSDDMEYTYSELKYGNRSYSDIISELGGRTVTTGHCHLDPDIHREVVSRPAGWRPAFGQANAALSHLQNQGVGIGDIFLFFGWFRQTEHTAGGRLKYSPGSPGIHMIYGYLQVGEILHPKTDSIPYWLGKHPHCNPGHKNAEHNRIFIAKDNLEIKGLLCTLPGAGCFSAKKSLILTKSGMGRSCWQLPDCFRNVNISYHSPESWKPEGYFQSAAKGQEFVLEANDGITEWLLKLF